MDIDLNGIVVICGNYGSGKTETAINLAIHQKKTGKSVRLADLDLVNPYFRSREAKNRLESLGIPLILPDSQYMTADLPILSPAVAGAIIEPGDLTILDAGGDDVGVTVLAALNEQLAKKKVEMLQVINPHRPFTQTIEGCIKIKEEIQASSRLTVTGFIGNANMMDDTTPQTITRGYDMLLSLSKATGIRTAFITVPEDMLSDFPPVSFDCPVLPFRRELMFPWKK